jgi:hypothetical protein
MTYHLLERDWRCPRQGHVGCSCGEAESNASYTKYVPGASAFLVGETGNWQITRSVIAIPSLEFQVGANYSHNVMFSRW